MPATFFIVRSVVEPHLREKLEHWYANDHLPWALSVFKCEKAWRCWSTRDEGVHYAVYRFTDKASFGGSSFGRNLHSWRGHRVASSPGSYQYHCCQVGGA